MIGRVALRRLGCTAFTGAALLALSGCLPTSSQEPSTTETPAATGPAAPVETPAVPETTQPAAPAGPPAPAAAAEPLPVVPIPIPEIAQRAQATRDHVRAIRTTLGPDEATAQLLRRLQRTQQTLVEQQRDFDVRLSGRVSSREIEDLDRRWRRAQDDFREMQSELERRARSMDRDLQALVQLQTLWSRTIDATVPENLPDPLRASMQSTLGDIHRTVGELRARRAEVLSLQERVFQATGRVDANLERIARAREAGRVALFEAEYPPLWTALGRDSFEGHAAAAAAQTLERMSSDVRDFHREYRVRRRVHGALFLLTLLLLLEFRQRLRRLSEERRDLEPTAQLLRRPVSAAVLCAMLMAPFLYPQAPSAIMELGSLILIVPLVRLLLVILPEGTTPALFGLLALQGAVRILNLLPEGALLFRLGLLAITLLAAAGLAFLIRTRFLTRRMTSSAWGDAVRFAAQVALALLGLSLVCNLLGNVTLAAVLTRGVIRSASVSVSLFAATLLFDGLLWFILTAKPATYLNSVRHFEERIRRRLVRLLRVAAVFGWVAITLGLFELAPPVANGLRRLWGAALPVGAVRISVGDILTFVITLGVAMAIARLVNFALQEEIISRISLPRGLPRAITTSARYAILFLGFFLALAAAGVELSKFTLLAGAFGVGLGFGLQNIVSNFISGLILLFERPVLPGDYITIQNTEGQVQSVGIRSSIVRTYEGAEVIVPNADLISGEVTNWTLSDRSRRLEIPVGVAYGSDPARVVEILLAAVRPQPGVLEQPEPAVLFNGFGENALDFRVRFWTNRYESFPRVRSDVALAIQQAMAREGLVIPFPQRVVYTKPAPSTEPASPAPPPSPDDVGS